jgi:hypothetical protein
MIPLIDFQQRSLNGPVMKADEFDIAFSMKLREVVRKNNIKYEPEKLSVDDETADAIFQAAVELLAKVGLYNINTLRVVQLSQDEILTSAEERKRDPGEAFFGQGDDEMTIAFREGSDSRAPTLYIGVAGVIKEEEFVPLMTAFAKERRIKGFGISGGIDKVGDLVPRAGTLSEIECCLWEQKKLQEVLDSVGRPGMNLGLLCTASTVAATMQCVESSFRESRNTQIGIHVHPELKIDWDRLLLANYCESKGIVPWQSATTLIGGFCRDGADAAVAMVASMLAHMSYGHGPMCNVFPTDMNGNWGNRPAIWSAAAAMRASERNIRLAIGSGTVGDYLWIGTRLGVLQAAALALVYTKSGLSYSWLAASPQEALLMDDIMNAATKMAPGEASDLANAILEKIEVLAQEKEPHPEIITYMQFLDIEAGQPKPEYQRDIDQAKEDLIKIGVPL